jgi:hypothetical protein
MDVSDTLSFYRPQRALEHIQTLSEFKPVRFFAVLFPLWSAETTATQEEGRPYDLLEEYIERGIEQGQWRTAQELAHFFHLNTRLVEKVLSFLETIGHVTCTNKQWFLTARGQRSLRENIRYVPQQASYRLYFDSFCSKPLLREHYGKGLQILSSQEAALVARRARGGYQFRRLMSLQQWDATAITRLEMMQERQLYNLPPEAYNLHMRSLASVYIPMYIIEAEQQKNANLQSYYVVYTHIKGKRDTYFEEIVNTYPEIKRTLQAEQPLNASDLWREWLTKQRVSPIPPIQRDKNIWQVILPGRAFTSPQTELTIADVGTFRLEQGYFLQIWCDDPMIRREAALDRTLRIIQKRPHSITLREINELLRVFAEQLYTRALTLEDVHQRAKERDLTDLLDVIEAL